MGTRITGSGTRPRTRLAGRGSGRAARDAARATAGARHLERARDGLGRDRDGRDGPGTGGSGVIHRDHREAGSAGIAGSSSLHLSSFASTWVIGGAWTAGSMVAWMGLNPKTLQAHTSALLLVSLQGNHIWIMEQRIACSDFFSFDPREKL
mgnify:CR=1 FL=1